MKQPQFDKRTIHTPFWIHNATVAQRREKEQRRARIKLALAIMAVLVPVILAFVIAIQRLASALNDALQ